MKTSDTGVKMSSVRLVWASCQSQAGVSLLMSVETEEDYKLLVQYNTMKVNQRYGVLSLVTAGAVMIMSLGALSFAQTVTPLTCTASQASVATNQSVILTASGGNGTYAWSGTNLNITNATGNQFAVSYPNVGVYPVTVTSGGLTATCSVNVTTTSATGALMCSPAVQTVNANQTASVTASGGNGSYTWSATDLTITNPTGSGFSASYPSAGIHTLTVTSGGNTSTCAINVLSTGTTVPPVVTPGLPATGEGFGK